MSNPSQILSKFQWITFYPPTIITQPKITTQPKIIIQARSSDDFRRNRNSSIRLNLVNIGSKIWRWFLINFNKQKLVSLCKKDFQTQKCYCWNYYPANKYMLKVKNRNTRKRCEICSKLIKKTPKWH